MISGVHAGSQAGQASQVHHTQNSPAPKQKAAQSESNQDSVHLSSAARSGGDADHDGDSH